MDPALREIIRVGRRDEIEAVMRLDATGRLPPDARIVARFGDVVTCRLPRDRIGSVWSEDFVVSLKAPRALFQDPWAEDLVSIDGGAGREPSFNACRRVRRRPPLPETGAGVIVAVLDWGVDFAHPAFRRPDGSSRLLAIWDQSATGDRSPYPYGYGVVYDKIEIDAALARSDPYAALGYQSNKADRDGRGAHGTHVLDIAAGSGFAPHGEMGVAPDADLLFVHLDIRDGEDGSNLGDSVTLLEGLDWVRRRAAGRPFVINLSVGRHGGPHNGLTLVERAIDNFVMDAPGRAIVQSCGNYYLQRIHASGRLSLGETTALRWLVPERDETPNEIEVWYGSGDRLGATLEGPGGEFVALPLGGDGPVALEGRAVGHGYHRTNDPAAGDNHIEIFLSPRASAGEWRLSLTGEEIREGEWHAWVERDGVCAACQSRLHPDDVTPSVTTNTICNGRRSIAVAAYDTRYAHRPPGSFSSAGPTRDARDKPDISAPGVAIVAARSAPDAAQSGRPLVIAHSGTSMAAPHVTGTVALILQAADGALSAEDVRSILVESCDPVPSDLRWRLGAGYLNTPSAVESARCVARRSARENRPILLRPSDRRSRTAFARNVSFHDLSRQETRPMTRISQSGRLLSDAPAALAPYFETVAEPNDLLTGLQLGDLIVRRAVGEPALVHWGQVGDPTALSWNALGPVPGRCDRGQYGQFVRVEGDGGLAGWRRIANDQGFVTPGHLVLRPRAATEPAAEAEDWAQTVQDAETERTYTADLDDDFFRELFGIAARLKFAPEDMLGVMMSESGISASIINRHGGATGLIQFMPKTLVGLGWTAGNEAFARLSATEQLPWVERFYQPWRRYGLGSAGRLYQATFLPATMRLGSAPETVIAQRDGLNARAYAANSGFDADHKGYITVGDLTARVGRTAHGRRWQEALQRLRDAGARIQSAPPAPEPPKPVPVPPRPDPSPAAVIPAGGEVIETVPMLHSHVGTPPDLILRWNSMDAAPETVDIVVHLHGYSGRGKAMRIDRDKGAISGLDFANPQPPHEPGRTQPTLALLPRGNFFGGNSGNGYNFPALSDDAALSALIDVALARFSAAIGSGKPVGRGRLILTAHSGGGAGMMRLLRSVDPDEIHSFDALYGDATPLIAWATGRLAHGLAERSALRIVYRAGESTAAHSVTVRNAITPLVVAAELASLRALTGRFRAEATTVPHNDIPRTFGWVLLRDPAADLPLAAKKQSKPSPAPAGPKPSQQVSTSVSEVHLRKASVLRAEAGDRAYRLDDADMPARTATTEAEKVAQIIGITHYLDPAAKTHLRYQPDGRHTYCNIYAYDFATLCNVYIPRVWWNANALAALKAGRSVQAAYGKTVHELNANALHDWFAENGAAFGWIEVQDADELQAAAKRGEACVIVARRRKRALSGHIAAVIPEHDGFVATRVDGRVVNPVESQAGTKNTRAVVKKTRWWANAKTYDSFGLWRHP